MSIKYRILSERYRGVRDPSIGRNDRLAIPQMLVNIRECALGCVPIFTARLQIDSICHVNYRFSVLASLKQHANFGCSSKIKLKDHN